MKCKNVSDTLLANDTCSDVHISQFVACSLMVHDGELRADEQKQQIRVTVWNKRIDL